MATEEMLMPTLLGGNKVSPVADWNEYRDLNKDRKPGALPVQKEYTCPSQLPS